MCTLIQYFEYNGDMCTLIQYFEYMETCAHSVLRIYSRHVHSNSYFEYNGDMCTLIQYFEYNGDMCTLIQYFELRWRHVHSNSILRI